MWCERRGASHRPRQCNPTRGRGRQADRGEGVEQLRVRWCAVLRCLLCLTLCPHGWAPSPSQCDGLPHRLTRQRQLRCLRLTLRPRLTLHPSKCPTPARIRYLDPLAPSPAPSPRGHWPACALLPPAAASVSALPPAPSPPLAAATRQHMHPKQSLTCRPCMCTAPQHWHRPLTAAASPPPHPPAPAPPSAPGTRPPEWRAPLSSLPAPRPAPSGPPECWCSPSPG